MKRYLKIELSVNQFIIGIFLSIYYTNNKYIVNRCMYDVYH